MEMLKVISDVLSHEVLMKKSLIRNDSFMRSKLGLLGEGDGNGDKLTIRKRKVSGPAKCEILALLLDF